LNKQAARERQTILPTTPEGQRWT